jgi:mono/diheme cytochrome c family protein
VNSKYCTLSISFLVGVLAVASASAQAPKSGADEWIAPARSAKKKNPVAAETASLEKGKTVYMKECASCHGDAGKGDGSAVKDLEKKPNDLTLAKTLDQSDGALFWKLTEGKKPMASYEKTLSEEDRWNVINYTRTLASKSTK